MYDIYSLILIVLKWTFRLIEVLVIAILLYYASPDLERALIKFFDLCECQQVEEGGP